MKEARFAMLARSKPKESEPPGAAQQDIAERWTYYEQLAGVTGRGRARARATAATAKPRKPKEVKA